MDREVKKYIYNELIGGIQEIKRESEKIEQVLIEGREKENPDPDPEKMTEMLLKKTLDFVSNVTAFRILNKG